MEVEVVEDVADVVVEEFAEGHHGYALEVTAEAAAYEVDV